MSRPGYCVQIERDVVRNEQIELAISVEVDAGATRSESTLVREDAGSLSYVRECSVAVIPVQVIARPSRDEKILPAVVVEITDCDPKGVVLAKQTRFRRHISKGAVPVIPIEPVRRVRRWISE